MVEELHGVLVVGEALIDIVGGHRIVGGGPLNIATGVARLGTRPVSLLTSIGDDEDGQAIQRYLDNVNVVLVPGSRRDGPTSTALANLEDDGSATYTFDLHWGLPVSAKIGRPQILHVGSLGVFLEPGASQLESLLATAERSLVTFDPNIRPALVGRADHARERVIRIASRAHVVKLSDEDAAFLWPGRDAEFVADLLLELGVQLVAVTAGARGSQLWTPTASERIPAFAAKVADTIGAGDSFMAGLIHFVSGASPTAWPSLLVPIGKFASACAALTVGRTGAFAPSLDEVNELLANASRESDTLGQNDPPQFHSERT